MSHALLITTVVVGCFAVCMSGGLAVYFSTSRKRVGRAMALMLGGETIGSLVVTTFATLEVTGTLPDFPILASTALRWVALAVAVASSIHLSIVIKRVHG